MSPETVGRLVGPDDHTIGTPDSNGYPYPYAVVAGSFTGLASFGHPTTPDPNRPGGWQYLPIKHVLEVAIPHRREQRCTVLIEGNVSRRLEVVRGMSLEEAVENESECGMAVVWAIAQKQEVDTWDMQGGDELDAWLQQYRDPTSPMPDEFRRSWESVSEFAEWVYALMYNRLYLMQWLRHYQCGKYLGDPHDYTLGRLRVHKVPEMVEKYREQGVPINTSRKRLEQIHSQVCWDAGVTPESLPFDPLKADALRDRKEAADYQKIYYAPTGVSSDNYFADYEKQKMRRLGSADSIEFREVQMAKAIEDRLREGPVVAVGGAQHIRNVVRTRVEKGRIPAELVKWYLGTTACNAFPLGGQSYFSAA